MSNSALRLLAGAGAKDSPVYVDDVFSTHLYTGNGSTGHAQVNGIDLSGEGGLVWLKRRSDAGNQHCLFDTVRGATKRLYSDATSPESTGYLSSFNNNGFTLADGSYENGSGSPYVSWTFRKQEKFFDIVTFTGNSASTSGSSQTISHNLGSTPGMIIVKSVTGFGSWAVYHRSIPSNVLRLDQNGGTSGVGNPENYFGNNSSVVAPTATQFTVGGIDNVNYNGYTYVAYLFAHDEADFGKDSDETIIKCDSYTGNGTTGQFINVGFEPQFLFIKNTSSAYEWAMLDDMRGMGNTSRIGASRWLYADTTDAEVQIESQLRRESTGFHLTVPTYSGLLNNSGHTYIYMAIARPNKPASELAATDMFLVDEADNSDSSEPQFRSTFRVDFAIDNVTGGGNKHVSLRLLPKQYLKTNSTDAVSNENEYEFDYPNGFYARDDASSGKYAWMFRRTRGFFDAQTYKGTGTQTTRTHNLGVVPELIIIKGYDYSGTQWYVYKSPWQGAGAGLVLGTTAANADMGTTMPIDPTATQFTVSDLIFTNSASYNFLALMFASTSGISKIDSYSGTGSNVDVDCGFSAGARFILIKRTDDTGDWYLYDSVRGIVAGNDPYLFLNDNAAQVTNTDYIDPLNAGFTVTSSAPAGLNASGGSYLFLAIA